jgi:hypothetical protein
MWMKLAFLDHLPKMVNKFDQERGHELGVQKTWKKKKEPTYNQPKCWWGHQPLKWGKTPTKLTTFTKQGLRVFVDVANYKKTKVHGGEEIV